MQLDCPPSTKSGHTVLHSTTSSARASSVDGTVRPSVFAVLRLITSAYDEEIVAAVCYSLATNSEIVSEQKPMKVIIALTACDISHCQRSCSQLAGISVQLFVA